MRFLTPALVALLLNTVLPFAALAAPNPQAVGKCLDWWANEQIASVGRRAREHAITGVPPQGDIGKAAGALLNMCDRAVERYSETY